MKKNQSKKAAIITLSLLAMIGTYNAVVINSGSLLSAYDLKKFKRLDEVYGVVSAGRAPAVTSQWTKVKASTVAVAPVKEQAEVVEAAAAVSEAAIQESLDLKLVEVINPAKWQKEIQARQFSGSIVAREGVIESLTATLPEGKNIDISFSEMTGNTFEYDLDGEVFSGMMYQVDQNAYMVTLTNGPLEGTRLRFAGQMDPAAQRAHAENYLAENHNVEIGSFGQEIEAPVAHETEHTAAQTAEVQTFNFNG